MYSNRIRMRDLFQNPALSQVLPQFEKTDKRNDADRAEWVREKTVQYLCARLNGTRTEGGITITGTKSVVLRQIRSVRGNLETILKAMPRLVKHCRDNTPLYLPYESVAQIRNLQTNADKNKLIRAVLENVAYNPAFQSRKGERMDLYQTDEPYAVRQARWAKKVGIGRR